MFYLFRIPEVWHKFLAFNYELDGADCGREPDSPGPRERSLPWSPTPSSASSTAIEVCSFQSDVRQTLTS